MFSKCSFNFWNIWWHWGLSSGFSVWINCSLRRNDSYQKVPSLLRNSKNKTHIIILLVVGQMCTHTVWCWVWSGAWFEKIPSKQWWWLGQPHLYLLCLVENCLCPCEQNNSLVLCNCMFSWWWSSRITDHWSSWSRKFNPARPEWLVAVKEIELLRKTSQIGNFSATFWEHHSFLDQ